MLSSPNTHQEKPRSTVQQKLYSIIFESDTKLGMLFDLLLLINIVASVVIMTLDSVKAINLVYGTIFDYLEWTITILFVLEYLLRIYCFPKPLKYIISFYGIIDLCSLFPSFLGLLVGNTQYLLVIRLLRVLRTFRILRLVHFLKESQQLLLALKYSLRKIIVFFCAELILTIIFGAIMYVVEGEANGFTSIPRSIYWAVVTMTTVGYGDISPQTNLGQAISAFAMIIAYSIIVISTGMITSTVIKDMHTDDVKQETSTKIALGDNKSCPHCLSIIHKYPSTMQYCPHCGQSLPN